MLNLVAIIIEISRIFFLIIYSVYDDYDEKNVNKEKEKVLERISKDYKDCKIIGVENIQDIIE